MLKRILTKKTLKNNNHNKKKEIKKNKKHLKTIITIKEENDI